MNEKQILKIIEELKEANIQLINDVPFLNKEHLIWRIKRAFRRVK